MTTPFQTNLYEQYPQALERAQSIQLLVMDVDGVLTDGSLFISPDGVEHLKVFDSLDGHGIKLLVSKGIKCAIISGRNSSMVQMRAQALGVEFVNMGVENKVTVLEGLLHQLQIPFSACAVVGDDWPDLGMIKRAGLSCAPANAHSEVLHSVHYVCKKEGGKGAIREVCDLILSAQGHYQAILKEAFK